MGLAWNAQRWTIWLLALTLRLADASAETLPVSSAETEQAPASGWLQAVHGGFGDPAVNLFNPLVIFRGELYAGDFDQTHGCQLLRSADGVTWERVVGPGAPTAGGFGNPHNQSINTLTVFGDQLYAGTWNEIDDVALWRSPDGTTWEPIVGPGLSMPSGFGKLENSGITALGTFQGRLFAGTGSLYCKDGVEIWMWESKKAIWEPVAGERFTLQTAFARKASTCWRWRRSATRSISRRAISGPAARKSGAARMGGCRKPWWARHPPTAPAWGMSARGQAVLDERMMM